MKKASIVLIVICFISIFLLTSYYHSDEAISFHDQKFATVIKEVIGKSSKHIFKNDLKAITILHAIGKGISRIEGIEYLVNLKELSLENNRIKDVTPLIYLIKLQELNLHNNQIKDVTPLKNLLNLKKLDINNNQIKDIGPLNNLVKLENLNISNNQVESISIFRDLKKLTKKVYIQENPIIDYGPISDYYNKVKNKDLFPSIVSSAEKKTLFINEVMASNGSTIVDRDGNYSDWIEIYNASNSSINLNRFGLTDKFQKPGLWRFPDISIGVEDFMLIWASGNRSITQGRELYANFKISKYGESIILTNPDGVIIDAIMVPATSRNISFGRRSDGSKEWRFFEKPSPGSDNINLIFSHKSGFYTEPFDLQLETNDKETLIFYTLDCSEPTQNSLVYTSPIRIKSRKGGKNIISEINTTSIYWSKPKKEVFKGTVVRVRAYRKNLPVSKIITKTYFVDKKIHERYTLPVISLVTDPVNLFDYEKGIYTQGKAFDDFQKNYPEKAKKVNRKGNFREKGKEWERPIHIDFFEPNGFLGFSQNVGVRIFGGPLHRSLSQKPLILYARQKHDSSKFFDYEIFPGLRKSKNSSEVLDKFRHILLRISGQDAPYTLFADAMMQSLVKDILDTQAYRPAVVFLNSEYWGIYNLREHMDEHYLASHYNIDEDNIALLEGFVSVKAGKPKDREDFINILRFIRQNDPADKDNYDFIKGQLDVDNFIDYNVANIYFNNRDWPDNNNRYWRYNRTQYLPDVPYGHDGLWRWLVYDTDWGFGRGDGLKAHRYNTLKYATNEKHRSRSLLRLLLKNEDFGNSFINRFADYLNTIFREETVIEKINKMQKDLAPEMQEHIERWGLGGRSLKSIERWNRGVRHLILFASKRPRYMRKHIETYFGLEGLARVSLNAKNSNGGAIKINNIKLDDDDYPWEGLYFQGVPIKISAIPNEGFSFNGWEGDNKGNSNTITVNLKFDYSLTARFKKKDKKSLIYTLVKMILRTI